MRFNNLFSIVLLIFIVGSVSALSNPTTSTFSNTNSYGYQYTNPSFTQLYSSSDIATYWPQLADNIANDRCEANSDFLVMIPPGGCSPAVVRSDLLAEQNVPVFCQLQSVQVNPLIKVSSIKSISFQGKYPADVAGVSFYPARAALRSYTTLLSSPVVNNIGYVVIILKKQSNESAMEKTVKGNLTATMYYDADKAFGVGSSEFYLKQMGETEWDANKYLQGFWQGRGLLKLVDVQNDRATVEVLTNSDDVVRTVELKVGETSSPFYFPGFYCRAALRLKLNEIASPEDSVILNVDGVQMEARKGTKLTNTGCTVISVNVISGETGVAKISCAGKTFDLSLLNMYQAKFDLSGTTSTNQISSSLVDGSDNYYFAYSGYTQKAVMKGTTSLYNKEFVVLIKSSKTLENSVYSDLANRIDSTFQNPPADLSVENFKNKITPTGIRSSDVSVLFVDGNVGKIQFKGLVSSEGTSLDSTDSVTKDTNAELATSYFDKGDEVLKELLEQYASLGSETKRPGETAIMEQISLIERIQQKGIDYSARRIELMNQFLQLYPSSELAAGVRQKLTLAQTTDSKNAYKTVYSNNEYHSIGIAKFKPASTADKSFELVVNNRNLKDETGSASWHMGDIINLSKQDNNDGNDHLVVKSISNKEVVFDYYRLETKSNIKTTVLYRTLSLPYNINSETPASPVSIPKGDGKDSSSYQAYISNVNLERIAYVSIVSELKTNSQANFTFNIGVEQRAIELAPEKAKTRAEELNKTIKEWEEKNQKLGDLVKKWKGVCLATGLAMQVKNLVTGFSGESMARQNVMQVYKSTKCSTGAIDPRTTKPFISVDVCYNYYSSDISKDVAAYNTALQNVNKKIEGYNNNLTAFQQNSGCSFNVGNTKVTSKNIGSWADARQCLLYNELSTSTTITSDLKNDIQTRTAGQLGYIAQTIESNKDLSSVTTPTGMSDTVFALESTKTKEYSLNNYKIMNASVLQEKIFEDPRGVLTDLLDSAKGQNVGVATTSVGGQDKLIVIQKLGLSSNPVVFNFTLSDNTYVITGMDSVLANKISVTSNLGGKCSYKYNTPSVRFYDTDPNKGMPAIVPIDLAEGWYAFVPQSQGGILSNSVQGYQASGAVQFYYLCNVGPNGKEEMKQGDDICQSFSINNNNVEAFSQCSISSQQLSNLKNKVSRVIREVASRYANGVKFVNIDGVGNEIRVDAGLSGDANLYQCQDFMSPEDCKIMYNVCDPVICPPSRCNFGGKLPVANVIQSGIIGSLILCSQNSVLFGGDVYIPVCLTGINAGIEGYVSILKAEQKCLSEYAATGKHTGICDEMTAVYKCEFFWRQVSPLMQNLIPSLAEFAYNGKWNKQSGGGEYVTFQNSWDNMQKSVDYFKNTYASTSFTAFKFGNIEEVGTSVCQNFIGTSLPTSGKALDAMLKPESPAQFYGKFSSVILTEATVPSTSQYKVFYHIYAGTDIGARYSVYLKNPPTTSYYSIPQQVHVKSGYLATGEQATESIDFTAPTGYKELCLVINNQEECGFQSVSTEFAINALHDMYAEEQGATTNIATEKECISGTPSMLALANTNVQAGAEEAINPNIAMRGIVRVCATSSPGKSTSASNWKAVGYCGDKNLICWLDQSSVDTDAMNVLKNVNVISQAQDILSGDSETAKLYSDMQKSAEQLNNLKNNVSKLKFTEYELRDPSSKIQPLLDLAIQINTYSYENSQKAEALLWHYRIYSTVVRAILNLKSEKSAVIPSSVATPAPTAPAVTSTTTKTGTTSDNIYSLLRKDQNSFFILKDSVKTTYSIRKSGNAYLLYSGDYMTDIVVIEGGGKFLLGQEGYYCTFKDSSIACNKQI